MRITDVFNNTPHTLNEPAKFIITYNKRAKIFYGSI